MSVRIFLRRGGSRIAGTSEWDLKEQAKAGLQSDMVIAAIRELSRGGRVALDSTKRGPVVPAGGAVRMNPCCQPE